MTARIYDLSPPLGADLAVWPGDTPFASRFTATFAEGAGATVGAFSTTTHAGSHADAPLHTEAGGRAITDLPLEVFVGPCRVAAVPPVPLLAPEHLPAGAAGGGPPRLLLKTGSFADRRRFAAGFTALSPKLAAALAAQGLVLVGIDTPSVDPLDAEDLPAHHALAGAGVVILEGLVLDEVPPGDYELIALPLRLHGLEASPLRAVLRELPEGGG